jgi:hypothetical protein
MTAESFASFRGKWLALPHSISDELCGLTSLAFEMAAEDRSDDLVILIRNPFDQPGHEHELRSAASFCGPLNLCKSVGAHFDPDDDTSHDEREHTNILC